ncbi:hypothetical protein A8H39_00560 [Paraburkholderia fungorum]|uniref:hypothetical protein n=1 Tax=Paraburkholderia fungorum TaxID=134537 RepID=UPI00048222D5
MLRPIRGSLLSLVLLGASALTHAEPSVSDVNTAIQTGQITQAEQMIKEVEPNHPNAPRVHYMMALALSHIPGREAEARRELQQAMSINPQLPFADSAEVNALEERIRPHAKASSPVPASVNQPFVPNLHRPPESLYDRAMDFLQHNNIAVASVVGVIAVILIVLSFVGKKKKGGIAPMKKLKKDKKSRRSEPELPAADEGQEAETFDYGHQSGEHGGASDAHPEIEPWESQPHEEHEDFAR